MIRQPASLSLLAVLILAGLATPSHAAVRPPESVHIYDARPLKRLDLARPENARLAWDTMHVASALQGLANRKAPQIYTLFASEFGVDTDTFWLNWLRDDDGWLKSTTFQTTANLLELVSQFRSSFEGLVVYDPLVPATANLASTAAGCERLLPVRYDPAPGSVYRQLLEANYPVRLWLVNKDGTSIFRGSGTIPGLKIYSTGSAKCDAYVWALDRWVKSRQCAPGLAAYYLDAFWIKEPRRADPTMHTLSNHDYFVARRAFFFDLAPWADELPTDDPQQPLGTDRNTFLQVLRALYGRAGGDIMCIGGFTPWPYKYTSHASPAGKHDGVPTEWEHARLISQFNGYMEADAAGLAAMANASFYQHYPLKARYAQPNAKPDKGSWRAKGFLQPDGKVAPRFYLGHYVGDYDAPSWLYKAVPTFFPDPARGKVPLAWAFNPNLADRAPQVLAYAYRNATTNDFFISGDSGAGYLNPRGLTVRPDSNLPPGLKAWTRHCKEYYRKWDMTITGFILDGASGASTEPEYSAYASFSPDGAGTHFEKGPAILGGIPTCPERDLPDNVDAAAETIYKMSAKGTGPRFLWARSILKSPSWYAQLSSLLASKHPDAQITTVDPYTFFGLIREHAARN